MEPGCKFCLDYQPPAGDVQDKVLATHLQNCDDCQDQTVLL